MDVDKLNKHWVLKGFLILLYVVLAMKFVDSQGNYLQNSKPGICSNECSQWTPMEAWNGYLKRKEWKMVCEKWEIECCPGYMGPKCEKVEESRKIQEMQNTIQNLVSRLETTTREIEELKRTCNKVIIEESSKIQEMQNTIQNLVTRLDTTTREVEELKRTCNKVKAIYCNEGSVPCQNGYKCVRREEMCDRKVDCPDGSDEENCHITCPGGQIACNDKKACINRRQQCDGIRNCYDGSDEDENMCGETPPPTTTPTKAKTPRTTTMKAIPSSAISGSGNRKISEALDQETCKSLYNTLHYPDFPDWRPPPLNPSQNINKELCYYLLFVMQKKCKSSKVVVAPTLCKYIENFELLQ